MLELKENDSLDGIDLDVEDSAVGAELQLELIKRTRETCGDDFHISYTLPALASQFAPYSELLPEAFPYMDAINIMAYDYYWEGYSFDMDLAILDEMGVPRVKLALKGASLFCFA